MDLLAEKTKENSLPSTPRRTSMNYRIPQLIRLNEFPETLYEPALQLLESLNRFNRLLSQEMKWSRDQRETHSLPQTLLSILLTVDKGAATVAAQKFLEEKGTLKEGRELILDLRTIKTMLKKGDFINAEILLADTFYVSPKVYAKGIFEILTLAQSGKYVEAIKKIDSYLEILLEG
jgi:hypothetical protein